jgi:type I restriction enzyme M protein
MVKLCNPTCKRKGVPESVCDPSMGTGGFLTAYMKHFNNSVNWKNQQKQIHGWDHDNKVTGFARLNLFMESKGIPFDNLYCEDSLKNGIRTSYDIILANMPFGLKGLKFADCHESVKKLKIDGTKSEPLFLQLMMSSMNDGGRCAVVVPDGVLVNNSKQHNGTRKYLIENFNLKRVIKITGKIFTNTGIRPSILFFEKNGHTETVEFWEIEKNADDTIKETLIISVPRSKFDDACSLDMRRYQEISVVANTGGYPMVKLEELCTHNNGKTL